jgi:hypothetical protein
MPPKRDDRRALRELAHPLVDPVGVAPDRLYVLSPAHGGILELSGA